MDNEEAITPAPAPVEATSRRRKLIIIGSSVLAVALIGTTAVVLSNQGATEPLAAAGTTSAASPHASASGTPTAKPSASATASAKASSKASAKASDPASPNAPAAANPETGVDAGNAGGNSNAGGGVGGSNTGNGVPSVDDSGPGTAPQAPAPVAPGPEKPAPPAPVVPPVVPVVPVPDPPVVVPPASTDNAGTVLAYINALRSGAGQPALGTSCAWQQGHVSASVAKPGTVASVGEWTDAAHYAVVTNSRLKGAAVTVTDAGIATYYSVVLC